MKHALLFLTAIAALAQQGALIQTETRVVLVDAIVTGKNGAYVRDLTAKDFRVWQDNKEQTIKSLSLESASTASQPRPLVLFFDESSMEARDQVQLRQLASSFIDAETGPNRKMAMVAYNGGLRIAQNFTDNAGRLKDAIPQPDSRVPEAEGPQAQPQLGRSPVVMGVDDAAARNMIRSLRDLGKSLGVLPGRKIVVLFVGKLASSSNQRSDLRQAIEECNKSGVALYPIDVRPVSVQTDSGDQGGLGGRVSGMSAMGRMQRGGGPRGDSDESTAGAITDSGAGSQQLLFEMANGTGGFVIQNSNDLMGGMQKIASEQDQYYVISYTPPESKEGSCHALRVKVDRGGTNVRARSSYCTSKPLDLLAGTITGQDLEKRAAAAEVGNMAAQVELPYFYISANVARVHVAMEITPGALKFENQKGRLHAEINLLGIASTADGGVRARFSDNLKFDFDNEAQIRSWRSKPLHYEKEFRIAPGQYSFTMAFGQSGDAASFGKVEKALVVDSWTGAELALSPLALSREAHPAADLGLGMSIEGRTPLVAGGAQIVPSGSEVFSKSESGSFYVEVYDPDPASVTARVRVLDRQTGQPKWDSGLAKFPLPANEGKPSLPAISSLPLNALAPGSYRLEITASDSAGKQVTRTADFEVR